MKAVEPRSFFLNVPVSGGKETNKTALYEWGSRTTSKGTVFCVHGLTRNGRDFDALASALCEDYRVIAIDMAGRGKSEWHINPVFYSYPAYVADISNVVSQLSLHDIHWVGTSMGGILGMMVANSFPGLIKTLTLNDVGCLIPAEGIKRISGYVGNATNFPSRAAAEAELRRRCAPYGIKIEDDWQHLFTHSIEVGDNKNFRLAYDPDIAKGFADGEIKDVNLWGLWEAVKPIPTLLIRGNNSDLLTHQTALEMKNQHPNLTLLEVEGVGHAPALIDDGQIGAVKERIRLAA